MRFAAYLSAISVSLLLSTGASAQAVSVAGYTGYVGNRTDGSGTLIDTAGGLSASGNAWAVTGGSINNKGVRLDFSATPASGNLWTYSYTFSQASGALKSLGNFDLSVGSLFQPSDLASWTATATDSTGATLAISPTGPTAGSTGAATLSENTGSLSGPVVKSVSGLQWVLPASAYGFTVELSSTLAPIWGDFIVSASETTKTDYLAAWNSQFGLSTANAVGDGNNGGYVLIPGVVSAVPLPPALLLLLSGIGFMSLIGARRSRGS